VNALTSFKRPLQYCPQGTRGEGGNSQIFHPIPPQILWYRGPIFLLSLYGDAKADNGKMVTIGLPWPTSGNKIL